MPIVELQGCVNPTANLYVRSKGYTAASGSLKSINFVVDRSYDMLLFLTSKNFWAASMRTKQNTASVTREPIKVLNVVYPWYFSYIGVPNKSSLLKEFMNE